MKVYFWSLVLMVLLAPRATLALSPLVAELQTVATHYHQDPKRLDSIRAGLEQTITHDASAENLIALARVSFIWGEVRANSAEQKLAAYADGEKAAKRATELEPRNVRAHFWYALNLARLGQTQGITRSLSLLPTVQEEIQLILQLDPTFTPVYALAGNVYYEVPSLLGGDLAKAEAMFRTGLQQDPHFTTMRVGLGKTLLKRGELAEARRELQAVLDEQAPTNPADWHSRDLPEARELLATMPGKS